MSADAGATSGVLDPRPQDSRPLGVQQQGSRVGQRGHLVDDDPEPGRVVRGDLPVGEQLRVEPLLGPRGECGDELGDHLAAYRPELEGTPDARDTARFLLLTPPLPMLARAPYAGLAASAVSLMPLWARRKLRLPYLPMTERVLVRATGTALTRTIRWAMVAPR